MNNIFGNLQAAMATTDREINTAKGNIKAREDAKEAVEIASEMNKVRERVFSPLYAGANPVPPTGGFKSDISFPHLSHYLQFLKTNGLILDVRDMGIVKIAISREAMIGKRMRENLAMAGVIIGAGIGVIPLIGPVIPLTIGAGYIGRRELIKRRQYILERYGTLGDQIEDAGLNPVAHLVNATRVINYAASHVIPLTTDRDWRNITKHGIINPAMSVVSTGFKVAKSFFNDITDGTGILGKVFTKVANLDKDLKRVPWAANFVNTFDSVTKFIRPARAPAKAAA